MQYNAYFQITPCKKKQILAHIIYNNNTSKNTKTICSAITVIAVSYTINKFEENRNIECLTDQSTNNQDSFTSIPISAFLGAVDQSWDSKPFETKLSWHICKASLIDS